MTFNVVVRFARLAADRRWLIGLFLAAGFLSPAAPGDPAYYQRQGTWQESLQASLAALSRTALRDDIPPLETETRRGGQPPQFLSVRISGAQELYLFVTGIPDVKWGVADWADARLIDASGQATPVSRLPDLRAVLGRMEKDLTLRSGLYQKMRLGGKVFEQGLNVQANSAVRVPLDGRYEKFESWIGVDDWAGTNGTVRFSVVGARNAARKLLWNCLIRDFAEAAPRRQIAWEREDRIWEADWTPGDYRDLAQRYAQACRRVPPLAAQAGTLAGRVADAKGLDAVRLLYYHARGLDAALSRARSFDFTAFGLALADLEKSWPEKYPKHYAIRFQELRRLLTDSLDGFVPSDLDRFQAVARNLEALESLRREALLANPLLDFERLLVIKRKPIGEPRRSQWEDKGLGLYVGMPQQSSWAQGTMVNVDQWENEIDVLSPARPTGKLSTLYRPSGGQLITDVDLHWNADKMLFAMPGRSNLWQVWEIRADGTALRQLTPGEHPDVHNYDPCYLPSGRINFISTAPLQGVPCNASVIVGMMYQMDGDGKNIKQLCFEQDHDYNPSVLNNGRVLYLRWDYTDTPHVWNRILMSMNPDGTGQMEYYGANSYWPNAVFFPRAVPGHPTKIAGIVTGHHEGRVGDLVIFDPAQGRHEVDGVVQRIPFRGRKVEPKIEDKLVEHNWPKFLHPWPLNENYYLVACKSEPDSLWGIYLVDVFDNMTLVREEEGYALLEPIPLRARPLPPVIQDKTNPRRSDALVYMEDVYSGPGLKGVPRGTIKSLRVFTYHFGYQTLAGIDHRVGADGPWEAKRVLGTVPVEADGSAFFYVPAQQPLSFQPLDAEGKAVALMRSWMTAMPGENVSCVGCHDRQSTTPLSRKAMALNQAPRQLTPWYGPPRGFSFAREVQPVLDKYCVGCHNGQPRPDGAVPADLRRDQNAFVVYKASQLDGQIIRDTPKEKLLGKYGAVFEPSYVFLRQYLRVGGLESDLHLLPPKEFHADTSELVQMLQKGHHNVKLDAEAWDRLITWIDLNAPCHGTWSDTTKIPGNQCARRLELRKRYGGLVENCEEQPLPEPKPVTPILPEPLEQLKRPAVIVPGWPFEAAEAKRRQAASLPLPPRPAVGLAKADGGEGWGEGAAGEGVRGNLPDRINAGFRTERTIDLGNGVKLDLVWIPPGEFVMGDWAGTPDEQPPCRVRIANGFWMAATEISNEQYARFNPSHDSRFEHRSSWIFAEEYLGWPLNRPRQPVVRVSWDEAMAFCRWLSARLGEEVTLPTEAQWEWACRAGTDTPLFYGGLDDDFSRFANLGDKNLRKLADEGWRPKSPDLVPKDNRFDDGYLVTAEVGHYQPNAWGLYDMHGNAAEWTRSTYLPYPYPANDDRDDSASGTKKVVRGGSWRDRPKYSRSGFRLAYPGYQKVYNVGFRVIIEPHKIKTVATDARRLQLEF